MESVFIAFFALFFAIYAVCSCYLQLHGFIELTQKITGRYLHGKDASISCPVEGRMA